MSRKLPKVLNKEEQERLLKVFNTRYITQERNKVMIKLLLRTGMRLSEVRNLRWLDIEFLGSIGEIHIVNGKGAKDRVLYIKQDMVEDLISWKKRQVDEWGKSEYVFTTRNLRRIDPKGIRKTISIYSKKAKIDKHVTTHTMRHTFATELLNKTDNLRIVQEALGHEDIRTTQIYTHISNAQVKEAMLLL